MIEIRSQSLDHAHPWLFVKDTADTILRDLQQYVLDPAFELYGGFINRAPQWQKPEDSEKYRGCVVIRGNFLTYSHAFCLITDDKELIESLCTAIKENQARSEYRSARSAVLENLPVLKEFTKAANLHPGKYLFTGMNPAGEVVEITRVYRISEEYANENNLLYLERWEGRNSENILIGAAFSDGDKLATTKNWKLYREESV